MSPTFIVASVLVIFSLSAIASSDQHQQPLGGGIEQTCRLIAKGHHPIPYQFCVDSLNDEETELRPMQMLDLAYAATRAAKTPLRDTVAEIERLSAKVDAARPDALNETSKLRACQDAYASAGDTTDSAQETLRTRSFRDVIAALQVALSRIRQCEMQFKGETSPMAKVNGENEMLVKLAQVIVDWMH